MTRAKDALANMLGKIISGVVVAKNKEGNPYERLFLLFSDGTSFELWTESDDLRVASAIDQCGMDEIVKVLNRRPNTEVHVFRPPHEDPDAPQRDMLTDDDA